MNDNKEALIILKWSGKEYQMSDLTEHDTVAVLKHEIFKKTQVRPERQKLLNLKHKGKMASDDVQLSNLELKPNFKLMMVGSTEADIENVCNRPEGTDTVIDDFDDSEEKDESLENRAVYLEKVRKRVRDYDIQEINPPREGKHLLVLDIDYTIFDHRSVAETGVELMRPHLHEFLKSAYEDYDIVIWSATGIKWIEEKMKLIGISTNPNYKIMFHLDSHAMISVYTAEKGVFDVKPLGVIWGKYPQYGPHNTIMFDDIRRNFLMNPKSGLRIRPYRQAHLNKETDIELILLSKYLKAIARNCADFNQLNHREWEQYINEDKE